MLDRLLDLFVSFANLFQIYTFVDHYEHGVVLRCGKYARTVGPGLRFLLPLGFEDIIKTNVKPEPQYLDNQSVHTSDGYLVNFQFALSYSIEDARTFLVEFENTDNLINIKAAGLAATLVRASTWNYCHSDEFLRRLKKDIKRTCRKYGIRVESVELLDFASGAADRIWLEGVNLSMGESE